MVGMESPTGGWATTGRDAELVFTEAGAAKFELVAPKVVGRLDWATAAG